MPLIEYLGETSHLEHHRKHETAICKCENGLDFVSGFFPRYILSDCASLNQNNININVHLYIYT